MNCEAWFMETFGFRYMGRYCVSNDSLPGMDPEALSISPPPGTLEVDISNTLSGGMVIMLPTPEPSVIQEDSPTPEPVSRLVPGSLSSPSPSLPLPSPPTADEVSNGLRQRGQRD